MSLVELCEHGADIDDEICGECYYEEGMRVGHVLGGVVAFGLMGMAEAIRWRARGPFRDEWCNCGDWTEQNPLYCPAHDENEGEP